VKLRWKEVSGVKKYHVQVSRTRSFQRILAEGDASASEWNWQYRLGMENSKGRAYFRVASVGDTGEVGAYSRPKPIAIPESILSLARKSEAPASTPVAVAPKPSPIVATTSNTRRWQAEAVLGIAYGNLNQSSQAADLTSVHPQSPYFHQQLEAEIEFERYEAMIQAGLTTFKAPDGITASTQPNLNALDWKLDLRRQTANHSLWHFSFGMTLDDSYRWIATGMQSVQTASALSLGPSLQVVRTYGKGALQPGTLRQFVCALDLPLTGAVTQGQAGFQGRIWGEWNLASFSNQTALGARAVASSDYLRWSEPTGTSTFSWSLWLAPALRF
jgi:hypothetical protein